MKIILFTLYLPFYGTWLPIFSTLIIYSPGKIWTYSLNIFNVPLCQVELFEIFPLPGHKRTLQAEVLRASALMWYCSLFGYILVVLVPLIRLNVYHFSLRLFWVSYIDQKSLLASIYLYLTLFFKRTLHFYI